MTTRATSSLLRFALPLATALFAGCTISIDDELLDSLGSEDTASDDGDDTGAPCDPVAEEICDGEDNDGDGLIDEDQVDSDEDGLCDALDVEECDGLDNDGDGLIDEDLADADGDGLCDALDEEECGDCIDNDGDGEADEDCKYNLEVFLTADDEYELFVDGASVGTDIGWSSAETWAVSVGSGAHHVAVHANDVGGAVAGFMSSVYLDGDLISQTGDGSWLGSYSDPGVGWETSTAGLSAETSAAACDPGRWNGRPVDLVATGAEWVWQGDCALPTKYTDNWWVLEFQVCESPAVEEICDGEDNDLDGRVDEDFPDTDGDGIADCVDVEECDCLDNDGDGEVDEGCKIELKVLSSGDDVAEVYVDGALVDSTSGWSDVSSYGSTLSPGTHHLAWYVADKSGVVAGFISAVYLNGSLAYSTGEGSILGTKTYPGAGWETSTAGLSPDVAASACASRWTGSSMSSTGADWVWFDDCTKPSVDKENWYVLEFEACGAY